MFSSYIPSMMESYDAVIGYGQGMATYYAIDKVPNAKRRILWLNTDLEKAHYDIDYIRRFYDKADAIFTDSMNGKRNAVRLFPSCAEKVHCFRNMMNTDRIRALANESCEMAADIHKPTIVTVGRIVEAKAMHLAAEAAAHLKAKGFSFRWVIVGDGNERPFLEKSITTHQVEDCVFLVGAKRNPYPWFKLCDIYVQTSIYEGSCMTINEAQVLGKPVVSTNFPAAYEKIEEGKSGYLVDMNGEAIAVGIEKLLSNKAKLSEMEEFVKHNCSDYTEQLDQLYKEFEMEA